MVYGIIVHTGLLEAPGSHRRSGPAPLGRAFKSPYDLDGACSLGIADLGLWVPYHLRALLGYASQECALQCEESGAVLRVSSVWRAL